MRRLALLLALCCAASSYDDVRLDLRVTGPVPGDTVLVDRGSSDGVAVGDRVLFYPRGGATVSGFILEVDERSAVVELNERGAGVEAGTRGEVTVPRARRAPEPPETPEPVEPEQPVPDHPPWENRDETYEPGDPRLTGMRPVRPAERPRQMTGLAYAIADLTESPAGDLADSLFRLGADVWFENPFRRGGRLHIHGELDYLTETDEEEGVDLLLKRLSYQWGGTRFDEQRWEAGRFLQHGMPEFGVLDGVEWVRLRDNGHRWGVSAGFMPEPDDDFDSFTDLQFAAFYEYVSDAREQLTVALGFQKSFHNGEADRDLLVTRVRWLPADRPWRFHGTVWVDFYTSGDPVKGSGIGLTQLIAVLGRAFGRDAAVDITVRHLEFPDIARKEFLRPAPEAIDDNRYESVAVDGWRRLSTELKLRGHLSAYNDDSGTGGAAELGAETEGLLLPRARVFLTVFASVARYEDVYGARGGFGRTEGRVRWDVFYEISLHHLAGVQDDRDDLIQHRVRASGGFGLDGGWDFAAHAEGVLYDSEFTWSIGLSVQKRF